MGDQYFLKMEQIHSSTWFQSITCVLWEHTLKNAIKGINFIDFIMGQLRSVLFLTYNLKMQKTPYIFQVFHVKTEVNEQKKKTHL